MKNKNNTKYAGVHLLAEFWGNQMIDDVGRIKSILTKSAKVSHNTSLGVDARKTSSGNISAFILLAESHISIHTWPKLDYIAIDIFSCGQKSKPHKALEFLEKIFKPKKMKTKEIKRGVLKVEKNNKKS